MNSKCCDLNLPDAFLFSQVPTSYPVSPNEQWPPVNVPVDADKKIQNLETQQLHTSANLLPHNLKPDRLATSKTSSNYDRALIPKEKVCPFSKPSRRNPCTTHANPKKRKDVIQNHLLQIKHQGYDDQHPENDPLWTSWEVDKYWLASRPPPLTSEEDKKAARSKAAKRSY